MAALIASPSHRADVPFTPFFAQGSSQSIPDRWLAWSNASYMIFGYMPWHFHADPRVTETMRLVSTHGLENLGRVARMLKQFTRKKAHGCIHGHAQDECVPDRLISPSISPSRL